MQILREDDPAMSALLRDGWRPAHRSWAARLVRRPDTEALTALVVRASQQGYVVTELGPDRDAALVALEAGNRADYPGGPATEPAARTASSLVAGRSAGTRWFGALLAGDLVAATAIRADGRRAETDTTSVAAAHRRRGLAEAVKAASVLALLGEGVVLFGTGGAEENVASIAMNRRLGYEITERWVTLLPPGAPGFSGATARGR